MPNSQQQKLRIIRSGNVSVTFCCPILVTFGEVKISVYLRNYLLDLSLKQSVHILLLSDIKRQNCYSVNMFSFSDSVNPRDGCVEISHEISSLWNTQDQQLSSITILLHCHAQDKLQHPVLTMAACLNALSCEHVVGKLDICTSNWKGIPKEVAGECVYGENLKEKDYIKVWNEGDEKRRTSP